MNRKQLIEGITLVGAGIVIFVVAGELYSVTPADDAWEVLILGIRVVSYICVVAGCILGIISVIPKGR